MAIDRRALLAGGAAAGLVTMIGVAHAGQSAAASSRWFVGGRRTADGTNGLAAFDEDGRALFDLPLPGRGHDMALHPHRRELVAFARRPGTFAAVVDLSARQVVRWFETPAARHLYGHGTFSPDGRLLYTVENDFDHERGVVGVYDADDSYRRVGELPSYGLGPHQVALMPDGETLVIANGGILTHPDMGRAKLNLPFMEPSVTFVARRTGELLETCALAPELFQLSLRHLAVASDGTVVVGGQYEGPQADIVPLVAVKDPGGPLRAVTESDRVLGAMNNYCGSVACDRSGRFAAVSAPRGGRITLWDIKARRMTCSVALPDGCAVAFSAGTDRFVATSGRGRAVWIDPEGGASELLSTQFPTPGQWDNHLRSVAI